MLILVFVLQLGPWPLSGSAHCINSLLVQTLLILVYDDITLYGFAEN